MRSKQGVPITSFPPFSDRPSVSVVVPTLNREEPLCKTLRYFLEVETYPDFEVIVVDQSKHHEPVTTEFLRAIQGRVRHLCVDYQNLPRARNEGCRIARGDVVLFVDDDVEPFPGFIRAHAEPYSNPQIAGVTGPSAGPGQPLLSAQELGERGVQSLKARKTMRFDVDFPFHAQWAVGCNMSFRRELIKTLGGFDENFHGVAVGEDVEFSWRIENAGGLIQYAPAARLVHLNVAGGGCRSDQREEYVRRYAESSHYFWLKLGLPFPTRFRLAWGAFRKHVANRRVLRDGLFVRLCGSFFRGMLAARRRFPS